MNDTTDYSGYKECGHPEYGNTSDGPQPNNCDCAEGSDLAEAERQQQNAAAIWQMAEDRRQDARQAMRDAEDAYEAACTSCTAATRALDDANGALRQARRDAGVTLTADGNVTR